MIKKKMGKRGKKRYCVYLFRFIIRKYNPFIGEEKKI